MRRLIYLDIAHFAVLCGTLSSWFLECISCDTALPMKQLELHTRDNMIRGATTVQTVHSASDRPLDSLSVVTEASAVCTVPKHVPGDRTILRRSPTVRKLFLAGSSLQVTILAILKHSSHRLIRCAASAPCAMAACGLAHCIQAQKCSFVPKETLP